MQKGDIVYLKSGSPPLVVENTSSNGTATVYWFNAGHHIERAELPFVCLTYGNPNEGASPLGSDSSEILTSRNHRS